MAVVEVHRAVRETELRIGRGEALIELRFADDSDWIRTRSGEWLRGGVDWMRKDIMEFDSEEFGPLEVHMRDVAAVHAPHKDTYVFDDRTALYGRGMLTEELVLVETEHGVVARSRETLWAIVEGGEREIDYWSMMLELGMSANRGNSEQVDFNLGFRLVREDRRTVTELDYLLNLGRAEGEQTVARHLVSFVNQVWLNEILFVQPIVGQLLSDRFQDITFRAQPAAAIGVRFLDLPNAWWHLSAGVGYQFLSLYRPFVTVDDPQHDGLVRLATNARFDMTEDIYLLIGWATNLTFTTVGNTNHTGTADLFLEVTNVLDVSFSFVYLRTEDAPPRADGSVPEKNDYFFVLGFALQLG